VRRDRRLGAHGQGEYGEARLKFGCALQVYVAPNVELPILASACATSAASRGCRACLMQHKRYDWGSDTRAFLVNAGANL
jgi:hypothetical protein